VVGVVAAVVVVDVVVVVGAAVGVFVVVAAALVVAVVEVETNLKELAVEVEQQILVQELLVFVVVGNVLRNAVVAAVAGLRGWWVG
jgi:hypothetical protein